MHRWRGSLQVDESRTCLRQQVTDLQQTGTLSSLLKITEGRMSCRVGKADAAIGSHQDHGRWGLAYTGAYLQKISSKLTEE